MMRSIFLLAVMASLYGIAIIVTIPSIMEPHITFIETSMYTPASYSGSSAMNCAAAMMPTPLMKYIMKKRKLRPLESFQAEARRVSNTPSSLLAYVTCARRSAPIDVRVAMLLKISST